MQAEREAWRNWSGSIVCHPARVLCPQSADEVASIVRDAHAANRTVRVVGTGHSSTGILESDDTLVSLKAMSGVIKSDRRTCTATVHAGSELQELGKKLYEEDLALPNYGDVATQTIGGAIGTGTHGAGILFRNLSDMLVGARLVNGTGEIRSIHRTDIDELRAARVALGSLGLFLEMDLQLVPAFDVVRREFAARTDDVLAHLDEMMQANRSFDFYWYPRRDDAKMRCVNPIGSGTTQLSWARMVEHREGYGHELIPTHSGIPHLFDEMEYCVPHDAGPACFQAVRERMIAKWRATVGWRVLYRTIAADDVYISPAQGRPTVTISLHQNSTLPWREFFDDIEPIFRDHGGRPHWAKKHNLTARELRPLYPHWDDFQRVRERFDPDGTFVSPYIRRLLLEDAA
jgi:FAD/FMN-containing dehydrogenase